MLIVILLVLFAAIVLIDFIPNFKQRDKKTNWVIGSFLAVGFTVLLLRYMDVLAQGQMQYLTIFLKNMFRK